MPAELAYIRDERSKEPADLTCSVTFKAAERELYMQTTAAKIEINVASQNSATKTIVSSDMLHLEVPFGLSSISATCSRWQLLRITCFDGARAWWSSCTGLLWLRVCMTTCSRVQPLY